MAYFDEHVIYCAIEVQDSDLIRFDITSIKAHV